MNLETAKIAPASEPEATDEGVVVARGKRVYLRTLTLGDLEHLSEWVEDPFLEQMVGSDFFYTYKHVYDKNPAFYEAVLTDPNEVSLIIMANRGWTKPVGLVRLFNIHLLQGYAFLETVIADQRARRRGLGVEASQLISYYGVDVLGLRRIEAKVYEFNLLSMNGLRKHGFKQEGILRKAGFQGGQYWDIVIFGVIKEEIEEQRKKDKMYFPFEGVEGNMSEPA